jgi:hypothetical protein
LPCHLTGHADEQSIHRNSHLGCAILPGSPTTQNPGHHRPLRCRNARGCGSHIPLAYPVAAQTQQVLTAGFSIDAVALRCIDGPSRTGPPPCAPHSCPTCLRCTPGAQCVRRAGPDSDSQVGETATAMWIGLDRKQIRAGARSPLPAKISVRNIRPSSTPATYRCTPSAMTKRGRAGRPLRLQRFPRRPCALYL